MRRDVEIDAGEVIERLIRDREHAEWLAQAARRDADEASRRLANVHRKLGGKDGERTEDVATRVVDAVHEFARTDAAMNKATYRLGRIADLTGFPATESK